MGVYGKDTQKKSAKAQFTRASERINFLCELFPICEKFFATAIVPSAMSTYPLGIGIALNTGAPLQMPQRCGGQTSGLATKRDTLQPPSVSSANRRRSRLADEPICMVLMSVQVDDNVGAISTIQS